MQAGALYTLYTHFISKFEVPHIIESLSATCKLMFYICNGISYPWPSQVCMAAFNHKNVGLSKTK